MRDYSTYINNHLNRVKDKEEKLKELFKTQNRQAREAARVLGEHFELNRIYLFGSLLSLDNFQLSSDIDLAVDGLDSGDFLDAYGLLEDMLDCSFDLVQMERVPDSLKKAIKKKGVLLYERP